MYESLGFQPLPSHAFNTRLCLGSRDGNSCPTRAEPLGRQGAGKELRQHSWSSCLSFLSPAVMSPQAWVPRLNSSLFVLQREGGLLGPPGSWVGEVPGGLDPGGLGVGK